jgi:hypothetical protein
MTVAAFLFLAAKMPNKIGLQLCNETMRGIRQHLAAPPIEQTLWSTLSDSQRRVLVVCAGLIGRRSVADWADFTPEQQTAIYQQIRKFGDISLAFKQLKEDGFDAKK